MQPFRQQYVKEKGKKARTKGKRKGIGVLVANRLIGDVIPVLITNEYSHRNHSNSIHKMTLYIFHTHPSSLWEIKNHSEKELCHRKITTKPILDHQTFCGNIISRRQTLIYQDISQHNNLT